MTWLKCLIVSEYDQEIPQWHTADQTTAPWGSATEHLQQQNIQKIIKAKRRTLSLRVCDKF